MTRLTRLDVSAGCSRCVGRLMRIMASRAGERSLTLHVTRGLEKTIGRTGKLEPVFRIASWIAIEMQHVVPERLSRSIRKNTTPRAQHRCGKSQTSGFEMALKADLDAPVRRETRRVDDRTTHQFDRDLLPRRIHMSLSRSMTSLAIDSFRQLGEVCASFS